jgi:hypothetical protein
MFLDTGGVNIRIDLILIFFPKEISDPKGASSLTWKLFRKIYVGNYNVTDFA